MIDGAKALRAAIERVFGTRTEVQRCQLHKRCNVAEYLPKNAHGYYDRPDRVLPLDRGTVPRNVKRWHGGDQPLRWTATGLLEARKKVPQGERLPRTSGAPSQTESVVDATGPGRVTCIPSRAATF